MLDGLVPPGNPVTIHFRSGVIHIRSEHPSKQEEKRGQQRRVSKDTQRLTRKSVALPLDRDDD